jgi:DNA polymerase-3 subunit alpha
MKNFITPNSHPSSFLTGSTLESMIDKAKELNTGYYVCTDNGYLTDTLKAYNYANKKGLKPILGCELYVILGSLRLGQKKASEKIKYFTITIHAKNQEAYQFLIKKISDKKRKTIKILDHDYPVFDWNDISDFAEEDFTAVIGGPQCIVCKNLLTGDKDFAEAIFLELKNKFKNNFYSSIIPMEFNKKWVTSSAFTFNNGQSVILNSSILAETDRAINFRVSLEDVANKPELHGTIRKIYVDGIGYNVNKKILSAQNYKEFKTINEDIFEKYNSFITKISKKYDVKILINDYSYFAHKDDQLVQNLKLGEEIRLSTQNFMKNSHEACSYLLKYYSSQEIEKFIQNSYEWAGNFDNFKLKYEYRLVKESNNSLQSTMDLIKKIGRFDINNIEHRKRLKYEIDVIHGNGVVDLLPYFFPISKALNYYTDNGRVVGPARGSGGGSFLMYCMGITQINPLKYGLYFSRFLTLGRIQKGTLPDVDVDLPDRELLVKEGGFLDLNYRDRWAQISIRTLMKLKSAIRDVNRFKKGKVEDEIETFAKNLEATPQGISDKDFVFGYEDTPGLIDRDPKLRDYINKRPEEWEIVKKTLGVPRQHGRHASAFVISDILINDVIPTMKVSDSENITQYEAKEVEAAGLIKYDFLVVKCLNDIELAIKYINQKNGGIDLKAGYFIHNNKNTYIWDLDEESDVFDMLAEGKTETVFQLNTSSVTPFVQSMMPKSVEDCAVVTSLVRPGPLEFIDERTGRNMAEEYVERRQGRSKGEMPILDDLLPETYGIMVYQEQITKVTKELTGWDDEKAEDVRIAVGKKQAKMIDELRPQFIEAAARQGRVNADTAEIVWSMIEKFGRYGFNKSHAVAYSLIAYACAYLKHHYPLEWWAAVLSNAEEKEITEILWPHVKDILSPPDINLSREEIVIDYETGTLRNKLSVLRGLGVKVAQNIIDNRPYLTIDDLVTKEVVGPSLVRSLIHVGVMDSLFSKNTNLMEKMQQFENALSAWEYKKKMHEKSLKELDLNLDLLSFIEAAKAHSLTKRCRHKIPEGKIDLKYAFMNPIKDYILKKSIFPTMPVKLYDVIKNNTKNVRMISSNENSYIISKKHGEVRLINGKTFQNIKDIPCQPNNKKIINFCIAGYVVESKEFSYKAGQKKALKMIVDIDGHIEEFVQWPDYETGILKYPENLKKNSVIFLFLHRKMDKEKYHTNIDEIIVEDIF